MVQLQFPEETLVGQAIFLQELLTHPVAKGSDKITREILADARFHLQSARDFKSDAFHNLCRARGIVEFPLDIPVRPPPKSFGHGNNACVDWPAL
jgi:hypothetical protein